MGGPVPPPIQPGEVRNPKGINQYTYRADAEKDLAEWCKKYGHELIERLLEDARKGKSKMMELALARILPAVKEVDLRIPGADPAELEDAIDAFLAKRGASGADAEPAARRTNGDGGVAP